MKAKDMQYGQKKTASERKTDRPGILCETSFAKNRDVMPQLYVSVSESS